MVFHNVCICQIIKLHTLNTHKNIRVGKLANTESASSEG